MCPPSDVPLVVGSANPVLLDEARVDGPRLSRDHGPLRAPVVGHAGRRVRRCPSGRMPMSTAAAPFSAPGLLVAFTEHSELLGGQPEYRRERLAAARGFLDVHPDLQVWMARTVDARIVELGRRPLAWQLVSFAIVSGWCRADAEFLFAKNFGHSVTRWVDGLFPSDVARLRDAADRLGTASPEVAGRPGHRVHVATDLGRRPHAGPSGHRGPGRGDVRVVLGPGAHLAIGVTTAPAALQPHQGDGTPEGGKVGQLDSVPVLEPRPGPAGRTAHSRSLDWMVTTRWS